MEKLDLRKELKHLYQPSAAQIEVVDVPEFKFAMIDGELEKSCAPGDSAAFQQALEALFGISYNLKFASKKREINPIDYTVMALEALWWVEDGEFDIARPDNWKWTAMILQPDHITDSMFQEALEQLKKKRENPAVDKLRLETFREGLCIQTMHIGPYSEEPATIRRMESFAAENGFTYRGRHHEIYLGDPRRSAPEKLKTILRQPVERNK
ncbi:MAG: hypothetical protein GXX08_05955 [Firmicutes bacterium]|nr:hypothetical protein [Bacillota bacterium]